MTCFAGPLLFNFSFIYFLFLLGGGKDLSSAGRGIIGVACNISHIPFEGVRKPNSPLSALPLTPVTHSPPSLLPVHFQRC